MRHEVYIEQSVVFHCARDGDEDYSIISSARDIPYMDESEENSISRDIGDIVQAKVGSSKTNNEQHCNYSFNGNWLATGYLVSHLNQIKL